MFNNTDGHPCPACHTVHEPYADDACTQARIDNGLDDTPDDDPQEPATWQ